MARVVGILGGMGPAATVDLFDRIVRATPARTDQEHLHILIDNNPAVPDRTDAILHGGPNPLPCLVAGVQGLEAQGADLVAMPCNTAHHYLPSMQAATACRILDMIAETASHIRRCHGEGLQVGIMATRGTLASALYQRALRIEGLAPVEPDEQGLSILMEAIYGPAGIKAGAPATGPQALLRHAAAALTDQGAQVLLLGCTELPLVLQDGDLPVPIVASNQVLAEAVIREALSE